MDDRWEKYGAWTGVAFVVLLLVGNFLLGFDQPTTQDSDDVIAQFIADNQDGYRTAAVLTGFATAFGLWFIGTLRSVLRRWEGGTGRLSGTVFGAGVVAFGIGLVGQIFFTAAARNVETGALLVFWDMAQITFTLIWFPIAVALGGTALLAQRTGVFPSWYAWIGFLVTALFLVGGASFFSESGAYSPGGSFVLIVFIVFAAWFLVTSFVTIGKAGKPAKMGAGSTTG